MTHYRVPFFEALRHTLSRRGIELRLSYGQATPEEAEKGDGADIAWATRLPTRYWWSGRLCWQPLRLQDDVDLVVMTAENKLLCNLYHQYRRGGAKVALWGHGANLQGDARSWRERFKRRVARRADWWMAYTDLSVPLITHSGFPRERITVLHNAVDTGEMRRQFLAVSAADRRAWRESLGIEAAAPVGIYLGSLYAEKRIDMLLEAARRVHQVVPDFVMLVVGAGPDRPLVEEAARQCPWIRYLGPLKGQAKVQALAAADLMLNPGLVGLGILDTFVCEVPMVTTDCGLHSPEIAYLAPGVNGLMTPDRLEDFVDEVVDLVRQPQRLAALRQGCAASAAEYTVERMAERFADGLEACLKAPSRRGDA